MTHEEQALADDKMRAEIAKLIDESSKLRAETTKILNENRWYPFVVGTGFTLAIIGIAKLIL